MSGKKSTSHKSKFILVILLFIVLAQGIYLISSQRSSLGSFNTTNKNELCKKFQDIVSKQRCWEDLIEKTLRDEDLDSAFNIVDQLYSSEPEFASDCHGYTHLIGEKAYEHFSNNQDIKLTSKASYCGFGFYHAFMENLLHTTGDLNQARKFCEYVGKQSEQSELTRLSCFHGIGHGLLEDVPNPIIKGDDQVIIEKPLAICTELSKSEVESYRCASGVFNVLAIYYGNPRVGLTINKNDPYLICHNQSSLPFKKACYDQMNSSVLFSLSQSDLKKASKFAENVKEDDLANEAIHGLAGAYGQINVGKVNYDGVVKICQSIQSRLTPQCLQGFLLGMLEGGKPGEEYLEAINFCSNEFMEEAEKIKCFNTLVWNVSVTNPQKLADICSSLEQKYQLNCNLTQN